MLTGAPTSADFALDLGSSKSRLSSAQGLLRSVPSVVAMRQGRDGRAPAAVGVRAKEMLGRAPSHVRVVSPIRAGAVVDFEVAEHLVRSLLTAVSGSSFRRPSVLVSVPQELGEAGRRALLDCVRASGAGRVQLVSGTLAAAIGADLPVFEPVANLVADVGGGRTEAALYSLGGAVASRSVELGGDQMDSDLGAWARKERGIVLSATTAEQLKLAHANGADKVPARGRDMATGAPRDLVATDDEISAVLLRTSNRIASVLVELLRSSPPELCSDLLDRGIILAGGVSEYAPMLQLLRDRTGLPALPVGEPAECVARGLSRLLLQPDLYGRAVG
ncbi:MAG: rod shape-determining protein MreB [Myxococcota bacterium]